MSIKQRDTLIMGALEEPGKPRPQPGIGLGLFGPMTPAQHARLSSLMGVVDDDDPTVMTAVDIAKKTGLGASAVRPGLKQLWKAGRVQRISFGEEQAAWRDKDRLQ